MDLLLYLSLKNTEICLPSFPNHLPNKWPFSAMVNRAIPGHGDPLKVKLSVPSIDEVLQHPNISRTFEEICEKTITNIESNCNSPVYLFWSGGIDSTTVLVSILKHWKNLENVNIVCSKESIKEYPEIWPLIVSKFKGRISSSYQHPSEYCKNGFVITGEFGDQIFGSDLIKKVSNICGEEYIFLPWESSIPNVFSKVMSDDISKHIVHSHMSTMEKCPFPIVTAFDWAWWFNFTNKWQHVKYRNLMLSGWKSPKTIERDVINFFESLDWQVWSLNNHDLKIQDTLMSYKYLAKQYIVDYTKHEEYLKKPKVGSMSNVWATKKIELSINTDFQYMTIDQLKDSQCF